MDESKPNEDNKQLSKTKIILISSIVVFIIGCTGYFLLERSSQFFYFFAHTGAVGLLGILGSLTGKLAQWKNRSFKTAFLLCCPMTIAAGVIAVLLWGAPYPCGGSVCLAIAITVIVVYLFLRKKNLPTSAPIR